MTTLVLLPGLDGTGFLFEPLIEALPKSLTPRVVGFSNDEPLGYEELLPVVLDALPKSGPFLLVAESFSGPLALRVAHRRPPGLLGVVLSATFVKNPLPWASILPQTLFGAERLTRLPDAVVFNALLSNYRTPRLEALLVRARSELTPHALQVRLRAASFVDATLELRECPVPLLYLRAERDVVVSRRCGVLIADTRPDARFVDLDAPHCLLQTRPVECAAAIAEFAEQSRVMSATAR